MDEEKVIAFSDTAGRMMRNHVCGFKKNAAQRGGNWNNGAHNGLFAVNSNNTPSNTNNNIGFRGIPFMDGVRDYGCGKHYQINSTSSGILAAR